MRWLSVLLFCLMLGGFSEGATKVDQPSSKNEVYARGDSPHLRLKDDSGTGDYEIILNSGVLKFTGLNAAQFFNIPNNGIFGIELNPPAGVIVTPVLSGGTLADGNYFIQVTALDTGGQTIGSAEQICTISGGAGAGRCTVSWTATPPPAVNYRVYVGTSAGGENKFFATGGPTSFNLTTLSGSVGSPPDATTAYQVRLTNIGITFADGSSQLTASGAGAFMFSGANILNANAGNVGLGKGLVFTPFSTLHVLTNGTDSFVTNEAYGVGLSNFIPGFIARASRGSFSVPSPSQIGDVVGLFSSRGRGATLFSAGDNGALRYVATENYSDTAFGTKAELRTTANGSFINTLRMTIFNDGKVNIGSATSSPLETLHVQGSVTSETVITANQGIAVLSVGIESLGHLNLATAAHAATFTAGNEVFILCDAGGGGFTVNLPSNAAGALSGRVYVVKNEGVANNCTIDPAGAETIDFSLPSLAVTPGTATRIVAHPSSGDWERW